MIKKISIYLVIVGFVVGLIGCSSSSDVNQEEEGANSGQDDIVISYNTPAQWANWSGVQEAFTKKTGIKAPSDSKNSGQTVTALIAEKDRPVADTAYYGITFGFQAVEEDLVEGYKPPHFDEIPDELKDPEGKWMTVHYGAIAFIVNKQALGDIPVPQSWADLLKPEYKGKIGFLDPPSASIGYNVALAANLAMGGTLDNWEPGIEYLKKLEQNQVIHPKQTATTKVTKGEIPILIDADFNGYRIKHVDKAPVEVVIPAEGSLKIPYTMSLVKNAPHPEAGKQFIDFALSDEGQRLFAEGYVRPIRESAMTEEIKKDFLPDSDYERVQEVDYMKMSEVQDEFIEKWKSEVLSQ